MRGTASIVDGLEDLDLWSEALQLELVSLVFPFVFTWPDTSTAILVQVCILVCMLETMRYIVANMKPFFKSVSKPFPVFMCYNVHYR